MSRTLIRLKTGVLMRRRVGPVLGLLLGGVLVLATSALRSREQPLILLQLARPNPIFPASLIPFSIAPEVCKNDHVPRVTLKVYNGAAQEVATLTLRGKAELLNGSPLRCGDYVASWDGTVNGGRSVAVPTSYLVLLEVDRLSQAKYLIVPQL
jgi:hypothetical protein